MTLDLGSTVDVRGAGYGYVIPRGNRSPLERNLDVYLTDWLWHLSDIRGGLR